MANMSEKSFTNEELGFELTSYTDKQQNVWFRGKDVAQILGYKDTKQAIKNMLMISTRCYFLKDLGGGSKRLLRSDGLFLSMSPAFMSLYLVQN